MKRTVSGTQPEKNCRLYHGQCTEFHTCVIHLYIIVSSGKPSDFQIYMYIFICVYVYIYWNIMYFLYLCFCLWYSVLCSPSWSIVSSIAISPTALATDSTITGCLDRAVPLLAHRLPSAMQYPGMLYTVSVWLHCPEFNGWRSKEGECVELKLCGETQ